MPGARGEVGASRFKICSECGRIRSKHDILSPPEDSLLPRTRSTPFELPLTQIARPQATFRGLPRAGAGTVA
jgi:hypothetical protein